MDIGEVHKNAKLLIDGAPYNVEEADFVKPGKGRAIYRLKLRNLFDGSNMERTYHSGEKIEEVQIASQEEQYLYQEGDRYVFMNTETFEQHFIDEAQIGDKKGFLKEGMIVVMVMMGDQPISVTIPNFVELKVVESSITSRSDTISPQMKSVKLETGCNIGVPAFIKEGDTIKVDTRTGTYVERIAVRK